MVGDADVAAGDFGEWMRAIESAIRDERGSDVPCGDCTACCRSSHFVHIGPHERETLARIPAELLFPAPGWPSGHVVLGYDERGHCPMLIDDKCSIYEHRPTTCRTYDCRVFAAAGIDADDDKIEITRRVHQWRFEVAPGDEATQAAVRAATRYLDQRADVLGCTPVNQTQLAILALEIYEVFLHCDEPDPEVVRAALAKVQ
jgi:Fe-S-cluster containining protein